MKKYSVKWENDKNKISEINNNPSKVPRSVTCNSNNNVIVTLSNNKLETDSNFQPQVGLKSGNSKAVIGRFLIFLMVGGILKYLNSELWTAVHIGLHSISKGDLLVKDGFSFKLIST